MDVDELLAEQQTQAEDGSDATDGGAGDADIEEAVIGVQEAIKEGVTVDDAVEMARRLPSRAPLFRANPHCQSAPRRPLRRLFACARIIPRGRASPPLL